MTTFALAIEMVVFHQSYKQLAHDHAVALQCDFQHQGTELYQNVFISNALRIAVD